MKPEVFWNMNMRGADPELRDTHQKWDEAMLKAETAFIEQVIGAYRELGNGDFMLVSLARNLRSRLRNEVIDCAYHARMQAKTLKSSAKKICRNCDLLRYVPDSMSHSKSSGCEVMGNREPDMEACDEFVEKEG